MSNNKISIFLGIIAVCLFLIIECNPKNSSDSNTTILEGNQKGLKDYYKDYFKMGVAVSPRSFNDSSQSALIISHFNSITAENVMKMGPIHPKESEYIWGPADEVLAYAEQYNLMLRGHTLCWHNQTPGWLFIDDSGAQVSKEVLLSRLEDHIRNVAGRYKSKIYAWDVVNEAISDSKDEFYRNSLWYQICGEDYLIKAFQWARQYAPDAKLFYNDYNVIDSVKAEKIVKMISDLRQKGAPIDGIGIQGHWSVFEPSRDQLITTLERFKPLNLDIHITELDISIYAKEHKRRDRLETDNDTFTPELEQLQVEEYKMIFEVFRQYKNDISSITFWNISDRHSWLDNFPVRGRKNYPLLFDQEDKPKKAFQEVINFDQ